MFSCSHLLITVTIMWWFYVLEYSVNNKGDLITRLESNVTLGKANDVFPQFQSQFIAFNQKVRPTFLLHVDHGSPGGISSSYLITSFADFCI